MSLLLDSPLVCQIPDCTTTQSEIEAELASFLASFCSVCKKERAGKLCGCAFPCSLTFRAQMLSKIHELIGIEKPPDRRAIQVCFKHPDLLKQAREACVAKRDDGNRQKRRISSASNEAVSIVRPSSQIPNISEQQPQPKMCKLQFGTENSENEDCEEFEELLPLSSSAPARKVIDNNSDTNLLSKPVRIRFNLGQIDDDDSSSDNDTDKEDEIQRKLSEIFGPDNEIVENVSPSNESESESEEFLVHTNLRQSKSALEKVMKIHFKDYKQRILAHEMKAVMHQSYLNDVQFVCKDGNVAVNSLILGSMSNFLYNILAEVPIVDKVKIIIVPDVSTNEMETLFKLLFNEGEVKNVSAKDVRKIKNLAILFKLEPILGLTRKPGRPKGSLNKPKTFSYNSSNSAAAKSSQIIEDNNSDINVGRHKRISVQNIKYKDDFILDDQERTTSGDAIIDENDEERGAEICPILVHNNSTNSTNQMQCDQIMNSSSFKIIPESNSSDILNQIVQQQNSAGDTNT